MKILLLFLFIAFSACRFQFKKEDARRLALNDIQQTDLDFSNVSKEKGMRKAFIQYLEDDGVLLRRDHLPILGADAVEFISSINDSSFTLTWAPQGADVAQSADLGYTYGVYTFKSADTSFQGTYVTIWHKSRDGKWKFVLDSGNEGVGENKIEGEKEQ